MLKAITNSSVRTNLRLNKSRYINQYSTKNNNNVAFGADFTKIIKHLKNKNSYMSLRSKFFYMCSRCGGELETILFNGAGKAFIAPLIIVFNPLSKEKKENKSYMAWKQPISAVVNLGAQLLILSSINKNFNKLASRGALGDLYSLKTTDQKLFDQNTKRLNILKGRISFVAAMVSMPIVCGITNWLHPRVINVVHQKKLKAQESSTVNKSKNYNECI